MEPVTPKPCSQKSATCLYTEMNPIYASHHVYCRSFLMLSEVRRPTKQSLEFRFCKQKSVWFFFTEICICSWWFWLPFPLKLAIYLSVRFSAILVLSDLLHCYKSNKYFANSFASVFSNQNNSTQTCLVLLTFQVPNRMSILYCVYHSKVSVTVWDTV